MKWVLIAVSLMVGVVGGAMAHPDQTEQVLGDTAEFSMAETALGGFLELLNAGRFEEAMQRYCGNYDRLEHWNPNDDPTDLAQLLEFGCTRNGLQCLKLGRVVERTKKRGGRFIFKVELVNDDGTPYVRPPCCGESGPPIRFFELEVRLVDGEYLVWTLPPYQA